MNLQISRRDVFLTVLLLGVFGCWVAYANYDIDVMRRELEGHAKTHIDDWFTEGGKPVDRSGYDYLAIVDSEKAFTLFGRGWGVVHVYIKEKNDPDFKTFKGLEFFYMRENGAWKLLDSAGCGAFEHHIRAFDEFMKIGVNVPDKVYNRALGAADESVMEHLKAGNATEHAS